MVSWPARTFRTVPWTPSSRRGSSADRRLTEVDVSVPPHIAGLPFTAVASRELERAMREVRTLEETYADVLRPLAGFLVRTESVASSKIEHVTASVEDFARALGGVRSNSSAVSMVSAGRAMTKLIDTAHPVITLDAILAAHHALMSEDPSERVSAGRLRDVQNWIGGSDHSPRGALYVPPPAETVDDLMADLITFANADDVHPVAQAAIVHAQFETIHPFTDGNGRIGRALLGAVLRRRGVARSTVVPVASALSADTEHYFDSLTAYRDGDADRIVEDIALSTQIAARESEHTAALFRTLPSDWRAAASPRRGSGAEDVIDHLLALPVFTVEQMAHETHRDEQTVFRAVARLEDSGVIHEVTDRKRDRVFAARDVLDELDDLDLRIRNAITAERRG
ncbi:Fic family protein [Curtobacterium sp. MCBD17_040]|uniref:Fic family protein n=1 Tax=Curtobacterium sp. MCBD17_040 TaxID=2175674 RepID=UPI000DAA9B83|nr:Fic family protein [Curtobacterium sp. MCBD17_040]WIB63758.1 Fic family protein [Curtobacterium sp. MCBD17_040]